MRDLALLAGDNVKFTEFRERMIVERRDSSSGCIDNVSKSLEELIRHAKDRDIRIGVENRYYYREIPIIGELEILFSRFGPGELFYWHDVGHAEVFERMGFYKHMELLMKFAGRLLGVHLHDILGFMDDHRPPGTGNFDFRTLKPYLKPDTIKVMEIHEPAGIEDLRRASKILSAMLG
jgi:sugar phosphate isomerase/epimerase